MRIEMVSSRALDSGAEARDAHAIMRSLFVHKIAAPHAAGFTARKQHLMSSSQYRGLAAVSIYNTYTFTAQTFESLTAQRTALAPTSLVQSPTETRFEGRRRYMQEHGRLPQMTRLQSGLEMFDVPPDASQTILQTVLDVTLEAAPATQWMSLWTDLPDVTPRAAAELVVYAMKDCEQQPAPFWPA